MPGFNELEVFHKILREAELAQKPPHECESYLQLSAEDKNHFDVTFLLWTKSSQAEIKTAVDPVAAFQKFQNQINRETTNQIQEEKIISLPTRTWQLSWMRYAAVFGLLLMATYFFISRPDVYSGGKSGLYVHLDDGSHIWLHGGAELKVKRFINQKRAVELNGIGYFQIKSDAERPFTIGANGLNVSVPGTEFIVDSETREVEVFEGAVEVTEENKSVLLRENEKVVFENGKADKQTTNGEKPDWINPILSFENAPLESVIRDLEAYFGVSIIITNSSTTNRCGFTSGSLAQTSFEDILTALKVTFDMKVSKTGPSSYEFSEISCK